MATSERKYAFFWGLLGDLAEGRPNLGPNTRLEVYRLMQFSLRDVLEKRLGAAETDRVFFDAGYVAGCHFHDHYLREIEGFDPFVQRLQEILQEMGIGILRMEKVDRERGEFVLTVSEDMDCSGLPMLDDEICHFDEGFIAALLECFSGQRFRVKEVNCWCSGDRTCRFVAQAV